MEDGLLFSHHNSWLLEFLYFFPLSYWRANSKSWTPFQDGPDGSVSVFVDLCGIWLVDPLILLARTLSESLKAPLTASVTFRVSGGTTSAPSHCRRGSLIWESDKCGLPSSRLLTVWQWANGSLSSRDLFVKTGVIIFSSLSWNS